MRNNLKKTVLTILGVIVFVLFAGFIVGTYMSDSYGTPADVSVSQ